MKRVVILDSEEGTVHICNYDEGQDGEIEEFIDGLGHSSSNCQWLIVSNLKITIDV